MTDPKDAPKPKPVPKKKPGLACQLVGPDGAIEGVIVNATYSHLWVDTKSNILHVHGIYKVKFTVPTMKVDIDSEAVVVKTRDEWQGKKKSDTVGLHVAELTFKKLTSEEKVGLAYLATFFGVPL